MRIVIKFLQSDETSEETKSIVLSNAPCLCFDDSWLRTVALDMTKFERAKHKKLVDELIQRRQQGELNLMIKNGSIINDITNKTAVVLS